MFAVPGRFGGPGNGPQIFAPLPPSVARGPLTRPQLFGPYTPGIQPGTVIADRWGAVDIPAQPAPQIAGFNPTLYPGDPALTYVLSFLYAFLVTDGNANVPWFAQWGYPLINSPLSLFDHNPSEAVFNTSYLAALYLWRDDQQGGQFEREADDWEVETSNWTMLWALPLGGQELQRQRAAYANQFVKAVVTGLERGLTPSWVQPGDPDPLAAQRGSFLGYWTNVMRMRATKWRRSKIRVPMSNGAPAQDFPAVEIRFEVRERLQPDLRRFQPMGWLDMKILRTAQGPLIEEEFDS